MTTTAAHTEADVYAALENIGLTNHTDQETTHTYAHTLHTYGWTPTDIHTLTTLATTWNDPNTRLSPCPTYQPLQTVLSQHWTDHSPTAILPWFHAHGLELTHAIELVIIGPRLTALIHTWNTTLPPHIAPYAYRAGLTLNEAAHHHHHHNTLTPDLLNLLTALNPQQAGRNSVSNEFCWAEIAGHEKPGHCQTCGN